MNPRFDLIATALPGLTALIRRPIVDSRGYFERIYCIEELAHVLGDRRIEQINHTSTVTRGAVRGLHFQFPPYAETKLISCLRGAVFDVAVDVRRGSPTFLQWHGRVLSADNREALIIPECFAHGFQTLESDCELLYLHTACYAPGSEGGLNARDPRIGITWPEEIAELSDRDARLPYMTEDFVGIPQ